MSCLISTRDFLLLADIQSATSVVCGARLNRGISHSIKALVPDGWPDNDEVKCLRYAKDGKTSVCN